MKKLLLFIPVIIFIASCTITKRVHRPGYHISSNRNIKKPTPKKEADTFEVKTKEDSTKVKSHKKVEVLVIKKTKSYQEKKTDTEIGNIPVVREKLNSSKNFIVNKLSKNKQQEKQTARKTDTDTDFGLWSLILAIIGAVSSLVFIYLLFLAYSEVLLIALLVIGFVSLLISFIFGVIAIRKNKNSLNKPKNSWMPILIVTLGEIVLLLFTIIMFGWGVPIIGVISLLLTILPVILILI